MTSDDLFWSSLCKSTMLLLAFTLLIGLARRQSAAVRHLLWMLSLVGAMAVPLLSLLTPRWMVTDRFDALAIAPLRASNLIRVDVVAGDGHDLPWGSLLIGVWAVGVCMFLWRWLWSLRQAKLIVQSAEPAPAGVVSALGASPESGAELRLSSRVRVPFTFGWIRPVVVLPQDAEQWPQSRLCLAWRHELEHIERRDCLSLWFAQCTAVLYWFHPLVWYAVRQAHVAAEQAADDRVVAKAEPAAYAAELLAVARLAQSPLSATAGMVTRSELELRVRAILDETRDRRPLTRRTVMIAASLLCACLLPLGAMQASKYAEVTGTVFDGTGVASNAKVTLTDQKTNAVRSTVTGQTGQYQFRDVAPGVYTLDIDLTGFPPVHIPDMAVAEGERITRKHIMPTGGTEPKRIRMGGNRMSAKLITKVMPPYPPEAKAAGIQGEVMLSAVISKEGDVTSLSVISSPDESLSNSALTAVRQWRYEPTLLNGNPIEVTTQVNINFTLSSNPPR